MGIASEATQSEPPLAMKVEKPASPKRRTIRLKDVEKALEIACERLGDTERSVATLRKWAAAGRVTPSGQVLTPEAVDAGIKAWLAKRAGTAPGGTSAPAAPSKEEARSPAERKPPTPQNQKRSRPVTAAPGATFGVPAAVVPAHASSSVVSAAKAAAAAAKAAAEKASKVASTVPAAEQASKVASTAQAAAPVAEPVQVAKKPRFAPQKQSYEELKEERQKQAAAIREMAKSRLADVLEEIGGHMAEILKRTGSEALSKWQAAPAMGDAERRELYIRLVHTVQEPVSIPEGLCAELMPHQVEGLEWLASLYVNGLHGILADEMGLGKTIQTLSLLLYLQETKGNVGPHLVVAPKSCLSNWEAEFAKFAPSFAVHTLTGDLEKREAEIAALRKSIAAGKPVACVTNYEQVYRNEDLLKMEWQLVVVDEGHRLKNPETVLHNAMKQLRCRMRLLLTGTPLQNSLNELWALLHYLLPDLFTCMMDFKSWFANPFKGLPGIQNEYDIQLTPEEEQQVITRMHGLLSPFLLQRLKAEALRDCLPPRTELTVRVPLSAWQAAAYAELEQKTISLMGDDNTVSSEQVNNALMQLRKIALHPYLFQDQYACDETLFKASGKVEALDRLLTKLLRFDHKVLIFSQFTSLLDILSAFLEWRGIDFVRLDGQVGHELRRERIDRFNADGKLKVFLLSSRAGGLGLNLQAADTVVLFDIDWNPQNDKQAVARVHRVGQQREVRVIRLITDTPVERHMEQRCKEKLEMEEKIMGAGMFRRQVTADQRRQALHAVLGLGSSAAEAPGDGKASEQPVDASNITSLEEVSRGLARSEAEFQAFVKMDKALVPPGQEPLQLRLQRHGRLMSPSEVPAGFTGFRGEDTA